MSTSTTDARGHDVRLAAQYAATVALSDGDKADEVLPRVLAGIGGALGWRFGAIWLVDARAEVVRARATWTATPGLAHFAALTLALPLARGIGLPGRVWQSGEPAWIGDVTTDDNFPRRDHARAAGLHASFGIPIRRRGEILGVFEFFSDVLEEVDESLLTMLDGVGLQIAVFIQRTALIDKLSDAQERLRVALEVGRMGTWEWELLRDHVTWSPNLEDVHGIPRGSFGGTFEDYQRDLHPEDRERVVAALGATMSTGKKELLEEYRIVRPDGQIRWLEARGAMVLDDHGKPARYLGICMDRSEQKETEAALKHALRMREQLLAVVSHDLRSPLVAIMTAAQVLSTRTDVDVGDAGGESVLRAGDRMDRLVSDLLDFAAIDSGHLAVEKSAQPLGRLVDETLALLAAPAAAQRSITLAAAAVDATATTIVSCDRERVLQVLANLVGNAVKFTPVGGRVEVALRAVGGEVHVAVSDSGPGIPAEQLPHIFEPYWQGKRVSSGVGLGLFIVQGIVAAHGGRVWIEPGPGARFVFSLPG